MEDFIDEEQNTVSSFDFKQYLVKLAANYKWVILSVFLSLSAGFLYLRYQVAQYEIDGYILLGGGDVENGTTAALSNAGIISSTDATANTINNEIFILRSSKMIGTVVDSLNLEIEVTENGHFKSQPTYVDSLPIAIRVRKPQRYLDRGTPQYIFTVNKAGFKLKLGEKVTNGTYGKPFILDKDTVTISPASGLNLQDIPEKEYTLKIQGRLQTILKYRNRLTISQAKSAGLGLLQISIIDELPIRGTNIIATLIGCYNTSFLEYKNLATKRALRFLEQRLASVSEDLKAQEDRVRDFKASNNIYDVPTAATTILGKIEETDLQKSQNAFQSDLLSLVERSVKRYNGNEEIVANASGLADPVLASQVAAYNTLVQQKESLLSINTENEPRITPLNDQLSDLRTNILKNIANIRRQIGVSSQFLSKQSDSFSGKFKALPEKEKQFLELTRSLSVQETLYTFILQKKEETQLQLVSEGVARTRAVDDILSAGMVFPKKSMIYMTAFGIGLFLPLVVIFLIVFLNKKIESKKEIEDRTTAPILGELSMSELSGEAIVITSNNRTAIAEQFRSIRTNLSYIGAGLKQRVFIVTSSISGEGKSFVSMNLANSIAIIEKKVVVLELDLRKPGLSNKLGVKSKTGISEYLINDKLKPEDIIVPLAGYPNLSLISSGPVPPNPGELITSKRMSDLIDYLKKHFDYVIMDTPPVGLVADSISLAAMADTSIFVIRHKYSYRSSLNLVNDLKQNKKVPNLSLIINGISDDQSYGAGYGYGYGYGYGNYGYGYYSDDAEKESKSFINNIKSRFKK